jgi:hypothetical protein
MTGEKIRSGRKHGAPTIGVEKIGTFVNSGAMEKAIGHTDYTHQPVGGKRPSLRRP